jgi:D-glycero-alpha-D-manno-heptose-7-phosphate kinase
MILTKTPLRISLLGGGTDYPEYFNREQGCVFGMAINRYTYLAVRRLHNFFKVKYKVVYSRTEETASVEQIQHPSVRACLQYLKVADPLEIHHIADWPSRTGLGSSSSFTVGLLKALHAYQGREISADDLARQAITVEREVIKERVGFQDQVWAAFGGVGTIAFRPVDKYVYEPFPVSRDTEDAFLAHALLLYLDINRLAHEVLDEQVKKTSSQANDVLLKEMLALVPEGRTCFARRDFKGLGRTLDEGWTIKKRLSSKISSDHIDSIYETAMRNGAYGGKLLGAGAGGFLFLLAPPELHERILNALLPLNPATFRPSHTGAQIIYHEDQ